jgi:hypothetical protein
VCRDVITSSLRFAGKTIVTRRCWTKGLWRLGGKSMPANAAATAAYAMLSRKEYGGILSWPPIPITIRNPSSDRHVQDLRVHRLERRTEFDKFSKRPKSFGKDRSADSFVSDKSGLFQRLRCSFNFPLFCVSTNVMGVSSAMPIHRSQMACFLFPVHEKVEVRSACYAGTFVQFDYWSVSLDGRRLVEQRRHC